MATIKIAGDAVVITSTIALGDLLLAENQKPRILALDEYNPNTQVTEEVFRMGISKGSGYGSIGNCGVSFSKTTRDENGKATVTLLVPESVEDAKLWVLDNYGAAIALLNQTERIFEKNFEALKEERAAMLEAITTL